MNWNKIDNEQALDEVIQLSYQEPVLLFKHSYRCSISSVALSRMEKAWNGSVIKPYLVDVIGQRPISNRIAQALEITHESPQAIVLQDGECVYKASHLEISYKEIQDSIKS
ncbi:MAG: bacillithiol system redox-active protein YtxJ [Sphingobacteriales bacterium]|nr:MAG: bacillithiol system redox-active protein YtxJ [Sphingobacteriales bacterium]